MLGHLGVYKTYTKVHKRQKSEKFLAGQSEILNQIKGFKIT
jgi:hypothetical protein